MGIDKNHPRICVKTKKTRTAEAGVTRDFTE